MDKLTQHFRTRWRDVSLAQLENGRDGSATGGSKEKPPQGKATAPWRSFWYRPPEVPEGRPGLPAPERPRKAPSGGLQDKPGKGRDHYHTCYCLSGLSIAQHWGGDGLVGPATNLLERTDPLVNVTEARLAEWTRLVAQLPKN